MDRETRTIDSNATVGSKGRAAKQIRGVERRAIHEVKLFLAMFLYLFVLLGIFTLYESVVLAEHKINFTHYGFAAINALVFAKVMLVAEDLHLGRRLESLRVIYSIALKSLLFAVVLFSFHVIEETVVGMWNGKTIAESIPSFGAGYGLMGALTVVVIMTFALIPYFAYTELARAIGKDELRAILLGRCADVSARQPASSPPKS